MRLPGFLLRWRRSLGLRLALLFVVLALVMATVFLAGMQRALSGGWTSFVRPLLVDYVDRLAAEIGSPPDRARAEALVARLPLAIRIEGPAVNYDSAPDSTAGRWRPDRLDPDDDHARSHDGDWLLLRTTADGHRIVFGLADGPWRDRPRWIGWATLAVLLALTAAAYGATRRLFRPIADIGAGAARYGRGDFSTPIPVRGGDELGDLAGQVNTMATELEAMLEAKRGLLLAISHELRSPLTRARLNAELVGEGDARDALLRDLSEMRELIHDLLEGERLANGHSALLRESTDLAGLTHRLLVEQFSDHPVTLTVAPGLPPVAVDPARIRLMLRNLLRNALQHGAAEPPPELALAVEGADVVFTVRDHGPGVPADRLAQLAQAFYRADASRGRATGGVGLGLYLARRVAEAHGGRLELSRAEPGLRARVRLPIA